MARKLSAAEGADTMAHKPSARASGTADKADRAASAEMVDKADMPESAP
jgi:hypothetical protein